MEGYGGCSIQLNVLRNRCSRMIAVDRVGEALG